MPREHGLRGEMEERMLDRFMRILLIAAIGMVTLVRPAAAVSCENVASTLLQDGKITSATLVAAGAFTPPPESMGLPMGGPGVLEAYKNMPAFCRVTATLTPTPDSDIKIEVWMPAANWNGKLVGIGNGIWAGTIGYFSMAEPVTRGYAVVATDTGHVGNGLDALWAIDHRQKLIDFGYRAVHENDGQGEGHPGGILRAQGTGPRCGSVVRQAGARA